MVKGRQGLFLEGWKFVVYLAVPITASIYFSNPENQKKSADYWQYVKYPPNPSTGWKEQIELLQSQSKQREIYRQQLQQLNSDNNNKNNDNNATTTVKSTVDTDAIVTDDVHNENNTNIGWRWLRWIGLGPKT